MTMVCDFNAKKIRKRLEILKGELLGKIRMNFYTTPSLSLVMITLST